MREQTQSVPGTPAASHFRSPRDASKTEWARENQVRGLSGVADTFSEHPTGSWPPEDRVVRPGTLRQHRKGPWDRKAVSGLQQRQPLLAEPEAGAGRRFKIPGLKTDEADLGWRRGGRPSLQIAPGAGVQVGLGVSALDRAPDAGL